MSGNNSDQSRFDNTESEDRPFFTAVLTPYRSLGPNGFLILMFCLGLISFVAGAVFWSIGAWPVFGFFGLDMALIWLAFRLNYASARQFEEIRLSRYEILVRKVGPGKRNLEYRFNPMWVRLSVDKIEDEGVTKISLTSRGETVDLGNFLNPEDRTSFAGAMINALATAKAGGV
ncbi:DUF2244 domain-containing protein [Roseibium alexandrii]|uniref:DUF2244 domain-containing protein n=1 Tax=Roseibium alexandrii TaxID=388408 RepID=A0A0M7AGH5_9HYPH|nr:DUF2244 domain-containing protein [Roseibium alexandrii]CTQ74198.1 hypothetical protein LAX5112_03793 [Roseibium alexandrii]